MASPGCQRPSPFPLPAATAATADLMDRDCCAIVQPDAFIAAGVGQLRKIAGYAEIRHKLCIPHHGGDGFAVAAHLQLSASVEISIRSPTSGTGPTTST